VDRGKLGRLHDLSGRVAIVMGSARGIGLAIAEGLLAAGLMAMTGSMAAAFAEKGIRVNALAPGPSTPTSGRTHWRRSSP
jgi:gluconate 5-dehydrogenase